MNLYKISNFYHEWGCDENGDECLVDICIHIAAETRGKARALFLQTEWGQGWEFASEFRVSLIAKAVDLPAGLDEDYIWARANEPDFKYLTAYVSPRKVVIRRLYPYREKREGIREMDESQELERLESQIAALDMQIEPLAHERSELQEKVAAIRKRMTFAQYGFEIDEPIGITIEFLRMLNERGWASWEIKSAEEAPVVYLRSLDERHDRVLGTISSALRSGWGTGNIPLDILRGMKAAYTQQHA